MAGLLVSVRSADEARAALEGGAAVLDVKEPDRGPLGRADPQVWRAVRQVVPEAIPVSVALGELPDWENAEFPSPESYSGLSYRKLGLAGVGPGWVGDWVRLRLAMGEGPAWVAVAYADWGGAGAPHPDDVLEAAYLTGCVGILLDTWDKARPSPVDSSWGPWIRKAQACDLFVALAGGLDAAAILRLSPLRPELFAVRGAACSKADRRSAVEPDRVARLAGAAGSPAPLRRAGTGLSRAQQFLSSSPPPSARRHERIGGV